MFPGVLYTEVCYYDNLWNEFTISSCLGADTLLDTALEFTDIFCCTFFSPDFLGIRVIVVLLCRREDGCKEARLGKIEYHKRSVGIATGKVWAPLHWHPTSFSQAQSTGKNKFTGVSRALLKFERSEWAFQGHGEQPMCRN
ncbi:hypothetical protein SUGI_0539230 [Cryptomeria japonica]|nr:hypothetical protein SUGI_0539230 [Cryptomeria japonica]